MKPEYIQIIGTTRVNCSDYFCCNNTSFMQVPQTLGIDRSDWALKAPLHFPGQFCTIATGPLLSADRDDLR
jgi:hypothetical protein